MTDINSMNFIIKSSRATSRVNWLKYEDTDVSRAIAAIIWHGWEFQPLQNPEDEGSDGPWNVGVFVF
jgi:hypothetical protein